MLGQALVFLSIPMVTAFNYTDLSICQSNMTTTVEEDMDLHTGSYQMGSLILTALVGILSLAGLKMKYQRKNAK